MTGSTLRRLTPALIAAALLTASCDGEQAPAPTTPPPAPPASVTLEIETRSWGFGSDYTYSETTIGTETVTLAPGESAEAPGSGPEFTFVGFDGDDVVLLSSSPLKTSEAQSPDNAETELRFTDNAAYWTPSEDGGQLYEFTVVH